MTALKGIQTRLNLARLMLITDVREATGDLATFTDQTLAAGVDIVQLRDDKASMDGRLAALKQLRTVAYRYQGLVAVYEDTDLAKDFDTDVLQLPKGGKVRKARRYMHRYAVLGLSCHSKSEVDDALADPEIAFLTVGPVFGGLGIPGLTPGLDLIRHAARAASANPKPWFAIGGIDTQNLDGVLAAGARRIAVGRAICRSDDPAGATEEMSGRLRTAWNADPAMQKITFDASHTVRPHATIKNADGAGSGDLRM